MTLSSQLKEFFYSLSATDKYSDFDSRKSFNRINKPDAATSLLGASHPNESASFSKASSSQPGSEGIHEVRLAWRHVKKWLHRHSEDINNSLSAACTESDINELEKDLSCSFPKCVSEFFYLTDGQSTFNDNGCSGLFFGLRLMPIDEIAVMTQSWRSVHESILSRGTSSKTPPAHLLPSGTDGDLGVAAGFTTRTSAVESSGKDFPEQYSVPPKSVLPIYAHSMWIPMITDSAGNFIGVDLSPGTSEASKIPDGVCGQVILFGRDFDTKVKIADTFGDFLLIFANDLEKGNWDLRSSSDSEDMVSGVDTELVFVDHETKKEMPYLEVLRERAIDQWISSLSSEGLQLESNKLLISKLRQKKETPVPISDAADQFINENLNKIDAVADDLANIEVSDADVPSSKGKTGNAKPKETKTTDEVATVETNTVDETTDNQQ